MKPIIIIHTNETGDIVACSNVPDLRIVVLDTTECPPLTDVFYPSIVISEEFQIKEVLQVYKKAITEALEQLVPRIKTSWHIGYLQKLAREERIYKHVRSGDLYIYHDDNMQEIETGTVYYALFDWQQAEKDFVKIEKQIAIELLKNYTN